VDIHSVLYLVILIIQIPFIFFLVFPFCKVIIGLFLRMPKLKKPALGQTDFGLVITAYKDIAITLPLVDSLLKQHYETYHVYLVADSCEISGLKFHANKVTVLKPETSLGSKVKSILYAIDNYIRPHTITVIFDPDNVAHPDVLSRLDAFFANGYFAVQGRRGPKNLDSMYACLDALGEYYYNHTQRLVPYMMGSSAPIAGSGMAINTEMYVEILHEIEEENKHQKVIVAEDKLLQSKLVDRGVRIGYDRDAVIYDEKITSGYQAERQRTRWLNSYFKHLKDSLGIIRRGIIKFDFNEFFFGLVITTPPIIIMVMYSFFFLVIDLFLDYRLSIAWAAAGCVFICNFILAPLLHKPEKEIWRALPGIPAFMFNQILALFRLKRSNADFMVTEKTKMLYIDDILKNKDK
jgi:cellulose synthase/poly-beta-1,6-N-acetylglucosamine synthase-like glycosyltransferase